MSAPATDARASVHVVAGALFDGQQVLIAQRPPGKHMAGGWEFPGGKVADGEAPYAALVRELREELHVEVEAAVPVIAYVHDYGDRRILLDLWRVTRYRGTPVSGEGQPIRWVQLRDLETAGLLAADAPMIEPLRRSFTQTIAESP
jgi:8-oxo-dGTP diphosphatase